MSFVFGKLSSLSLYCCAWGATLFNLTLAQVVYFSYLHSIPTLPKEKTIASKRLLFLHIPDFHWPLVFISLLQIPITSVLLQSWYLEHTTFWQAHIEPLAYAPILKDFFLLIFGFSEIDVKTHLGEFVILRIPRITLTLVTVFLFLGPLQKLTRLAWSLAWTIRKDPEKTVHRLHSIGSRSAYWVGLASRIYKDKKIVFPLLKFISKSQNPYGALFFIRHLEDMSKQPFSQSLLIKHLKYLASTTSLRHSSFAKKVRKNLYQCSQSEDRMFFWSALGIVSPLGDKKSFICMNSYLEKEISVAEYCAILNSWKNIATDNDYRSEDSILVRVLKNKDQALEVRLEAAILLGEKSFSGVVKVFVDCLVDETEEELKELLYKLLAQMNPYYLPHKKSVEYWQKWISVKGLE